MNPDDVDQLLESKFLTYADLSTIQARDNHDSMVEIGETYGIATSAVDGDMLPYTGDGIWVRSTVAERLQEAQLFLNRLLPTAKLQVVYGYRHLDVQRKAYERIRQNLLLKKRFHNEEELKEMAHISIAVPEVSGHPTGGAVDLHILMESSPLDMGTAIHDFSSHSYAFSPFVSKEAWHNRQLLRIF